MTTLILTEEEFVLVRLGVALLLNSSNILKRKDQEPLTTLIQKFAAELRKTNLN